MDVKLNEKYKKTHGNNPYLAAVCCAKQAHNIVNKYHHEISDAQAISHVISKKSIVLPEKVRKNTYMYDVLSQVDDKIVRKCVIDSYHMSLSANHLIYCYDDSLGYSRRARVRILTNMIVYHKEDSYE